MTDITYDPDFDYATACDELAEELGYVIKDGVPFDEYGKWISQYCFCNPHRYWNIYIVLVDHRERRGAAMETNRSAAQASQR